VRLNNNRMISFLSEHYILFSIISLLSFGIWINLSNQYGFPKLFIFWRWVSVLVLVNGLILFTVDYTDQVQLFHNFFQKDWNDYRVSFLLWVLIFVVFCFSFSYSFEFFIFVLVSFWASLMMISSIDFIMFYFLLELQSMSFYILASWRKTHRISIEGGLKYFFLSSFSSIIMLFGFSFVYAYCGLTNFNDIALVQWNIPSTQTLSLFFILVGFLFKLYCAPFHYWVADIYEGTTTVVVAVFSALSLLTFFHFLGKLFAGAYLPFLNTWQGMFEYLIPLTLLVGTLGAFYQMKLKRVLAYSSISNIGYFLMAYYYMDRAFIETIYGYVFFYSLSTVLLLLVSSFIVPVSSTEERGAENWSSWIGLHKMNWWLSILLVLSIFALSGIPPFGVFFGKWFLLSNLFLWGNYWWMFLAITMTLFTFYYYVRMIKVLTYGKLSQTTLVLKPVNTYSIFSFSALFGIMVWLSMLYFI
jgi:NADH-quinone oxidoreductase subunit N